eukprot:Filipodium_phascolosomae@DN174_c0_g1_i1.p1
MISLRNTEDLEREIDSFYQLHHKRLVKFIGACLEPPNLCLITEFMPGGSLHHLLHVRRVRLPLLTKLNMCIQMSDGVTYLHSREPKIIHRDLKSLNVVLDDNLNLKICDFGLTETMERTHITKKNNGGSPRYMAPELFDERSRHITEKIDVWAMGCILIEIFGGPLPYEGCNTLPELMRMMLMDLRIPYIPPNVPAELQSVMRACLLFNPRERLSASEVMARLKAIKADYKSKRLL